VSTTDTGMPSFWQMAANRMNPKPHPFTGNVVGWLQQKLREQTWSKEREILEALEVHRYVAVQSCHDVGKSFTASRKVAHWIETHPPGSAFAVTTAPTDPQVKAILWREIGRAHRKGGLIGRITLDAQWKLTHGLGPDELVAYGRKPADYEPAAFQGIHAEFVLVVIDEAGGVTKAIFEAVDSLVTNDNARVLAIGNPDDPSTHFADICKPGSGWHVIRIDGLESPNFTKAEVAKYPELRRYMIREGVAPSTEAIPASMRPLLLSPQWVNERIKRWGIASPMFQSKVRGKFPNIGLDTLIEPRWVVAAQNREQPADMTDPRIACDVARYGDDHTIIGLRYGNHFRVQHDIARGPTTETTGLIQQIGLPLPIRPTANVDDSGVGGGVVDQLMEHGYPVLPMISSAKCIEVLPNGKPRFVNARSEWWWHLRIVLAGPSGTGEDGLLDIDPDDDELASQIQSIKYTINSHGQISVETKAEMKKRGLPSPDRGDCLVMSLVVYVNLPDSMQDLALTGDLDNREW
jgi:hypothetical protein